MLAILVARRWSKSACRRSPRTSHLYFGMMSLDHPPVAPAPYVAAAIAGSPSWRRLTRCGFGWSSYIVPFCSSIRPRS